MSIKSRNELETEIYNLKSELKKANKTIKTLKHENKNKIGKIETELDMLSDELKKVNTELSKKKSEYVSLLNSYTNLNINIAELKEKFNEMKRQNKVLIRKLENSNDKEKFLKAKLNKNSANSSIPSSKEGLGNKAKKINHRQPTKRLQGGQVGHAFATLELSDNPSIIIKVKTKHTCSCGSKIELDEQPERRQVIAIKIQYEVIEYQGYHGHCPHCNKEILPKFPEKVSSRIQYDDSVKLFCTWFSDFANVPLRKIKEIIGAFTNTKGPSIGSMDTWKRQIYNKLEPIREQLKNIIIQRNVICSDETPYNNNGNRFHYAIGTFTNDISIVQAFKNRRIKSFKEMNVLDRYNGTVVSDHYSAYRSFKKIRNAECNVHISRELKGIIENYKREGAKKLYELLYEIKGLVDNSTTSSISIEAVQEYKEKWLSILDEWDCEFEAATKGKNSKYFDTERCLKKRLREFVDGHLLFAREAEVPFDNNLSERGVRYIKSKIKVSTCFRLINNADGYVTINSIIDTCRKNCLNPFETIKKILNGDKKVFNFLKLQQG